MLFDVLANLPFEPFRVDHLVDRRHRYQLDLDPRFPLIVRLLSFSNLDHPLRFNWHERLEIFVAVAGRGTFRMGDREVAFSRGDVVVVDNLKLHGLVSCQGPARLGMVINFMPELVCGPASFPCDSIYLQPFFSRPPASDPVLRPADEGHAAVLRTLGNMVECYFDPHTSGPGKQAGCKAHLLESLYLLARFFGLADAPAEDYDGRRRESLQFGRLHEYLRENYAEPITVCQAAAMVGMAEFRFMRFFKKATGSTFVTYLTQLRLANAHRLLTETGRSVADVAAATGFSDQSYFDRRFRNLYNQTPRQVRAAAGSSK